MNDAYKFSSVFRKILISPYLFLTCKNSLSPETLLAQGRNLEERERVIFKWNFFEYDFFFFLFAAGKIFNEKSWF